MTYKCKWCGEKVDDIDGMTTDPINKWEGIELTDEELEYTKRFEQLEIDINRKLRETDDEDMDGFDRWLKNRCSRRQKKIEIFKFQVLSLRLAEAGKLICMPCQSRWFDETYGDDFAEWTEH